MKSDPSVGYTVQNFMEVSTVRVVSSARFRLGEAPSYLKLGGPMLKFTPEGLANVHTKTGPWVTTSKIKKHIYVF